jgi:hypothetical protein
MPIVSVYLQQATDVADHVLYGVVNSTGGTPSVTVRTQENYGGSITNATGPFTGAEGKVVRRYTGEDWNTRKAEKLRPYVTAANVGTIASVEVGGNSFTSAGISGTWTVGDVWAIDYHSPYSFGKYSEAEKYNVAQTADEESKNSTTGGTTTGLPRDFMRPMFFNTEPKSGARDGNDDLIYYQYGAFLNNGEQDIDPGTTKWQLRCDTLARNYTNSAIPLPMPAIGRGDQYFNMLLDIGMRQETINMGGTLVDRGTPTAENPRLQTLFDIIRTQHSPQLNLSGEDQGGEGTPYTPANTLTYLRLTIGAGYEPSDYQESTGVGAGATTQTPAYAMNTNIIIRDRNYTPGGPRTDTTLGTQRTEKAYRGLVTQFSANLMGGKPDIWTWSMTFNVVKNEHDWTIENKLEAQN